MPFELLYLKKTITDSQENVGLQEGQQKAFRLPDVFCAQNFKAEAVQFKTKLISSIIFVVSHLNRA